MNMINFTVQIQLDSLHKKKKMFPSQSRKLLKRKAQANLENEPLVNSDLKCLTPSAGLPYEEATKVECDLLESRGVIPLKDKSTLLQLVRSSDHAKFY